MLRLHNLLSVSENELLNLDACLNVRKYEFTRIGSRYKMWCFVILAPSINVMTYYLLTCRNLVTNEAA